MFWKQVKCKSGSYTERSVYLIDTTKVCHWLSIGFASSLHRMWTILTRVANPGVGHSGAANHGGLGSRLAHKKRQQCANEKHRNSPLDSHDSIKIGYNHSMFCGSNACLTAGLHIAYTPAVYILYFRRILQKFLHYTTIDTIP